MEKAFNLTSPTHIQIEVTESCNHSCFYCYNHWRIKDYPKKHMTYSNAKILSQIIKKDIRPFIATITGGEPFINYSVTKLFAEELGKEEITVGINTNLVAAKKDKLEDISKTNPNITLLTSLPSFKREVYQQITGADTLPHYLKNLRDAIDVGIGVNVNMVAHQLNKNHVYDEGKFLLEEFGINSFAVTPMIRPALRTLDGMDLEDEDNVKIFTDLIKLREENGMRTAILEVTPRCGVPEELRDDAIFSRGCSAGKITSTISYNGDLRVCAHAPFSEGSLITENFADIWKKVEPWRDHGYMPSECRDCLEVQFCQGGCRFAGYKEGQPLDTKDYRMKEPIRLRKDTPTFSFDPALEYEVVPFRFRKEREGEYLLYCNGDFYLQMKD